MSNTIDIGRAVRFIGGALLFAAGLLVVFAAVERTGGRIGLGENANGDTTAVDEPALAGSEPLEDALNATREAQRIASIRLGDITYQALGYVRDPDRRVVVAVRNDGSGSWSNWETHVYDGTGDRPDLGPVGPDVHHWVSIGFDPDGYLHLTWGMHNDPLRYRRATGPVDRWEGALTGPLSMRGENEDRVAYIRFHLLDETLYATFRDGGSGDGDWFFYAYDAPREVWTAGPGLEATEGRLLDGRSDGQNPYLFRDPAMDDAGDIHFAWNWRTTPEVTTNHRVEYARWNGARYVTTSGMPLAVPLREGDAEAVDPADEGSGLEDIGALAIDADGHPHLAYRKDGPAGHMQMFHAWHDGAAWRSTQLTDTDYPSYFALTNDGGMYLSGAALAPFADGSVAVLFTDAADDNHLAAWTARLPFASWSKTIRYDGMDLGFYEPGIDRWLLRTQDRLHVPVTPWENSDPVGGWPIFVVDATGRAPDVELARFEAVAEAGHIRLAWTTDAELNVTGFRVERRAAAETFVRVGLVAAEGAPDRSASYGFVDDDLPVGVRTLTYRLGFVGGDGAVVYSRAVQVEMDAPRQVRLPGNYPNPTRDRTTVPYEIGRDGRVRMTLFNTLGQQVRTLVDAYREAGAHRVEVDLGSLASGVYVLRFELDGHRAENTITIAR